ncbi:hypothetical protein B0H14DRAFT_2879089, partial [Mycena olivaceomarginata]
LGFSDSAIYLRVTWRLFTALSFLPPCLPPPPSSISPSGRPPSALTLRSHCCSWIGSWPLVSSLPDLSPMVSCLCCARALPVS